MSAAATSTSVVSPSEATYQYVVTAQKPTCVSHSLAGNFTSPNDRNLIIGKCTLIEIHKITEEGVQPILEVPIYGRIASMEMFKPPNEKQDYLFLITESYDTCVLKYNSETNEIETVAAGSMEENVERPTENGIHAIIDPLCRMVALQLYEGSLKIIPLNFNSKYTASEAFNVRLDELEILDIKFLETNNESMPVIAVLYEDLKRARHVKTYHISLKEKELVKGSWEQPNVDKGSNILIPVSSPVGGVIIVGESMITYHDSVNFTSVALTQPTLFRSYGKIDNSRYLLGDCDGALYVLQLKINQTSKVVALEVERIGITSISSSITYIDNGYTFIGSTYGDSQLIRLQDTRDEEGNLFEIFSTYTNLGSIVDFCVVDLEKQGQDQIVTCSGGFKDSTLRIIRNGIGIDEIASIEFSGINGVWSVRLGEYDKFIIMTFLGATRALGFDKDEELGNIDIAGLETNKQTLTCETVLDGAFVQVTDTSARLINTTTLQLLDEWTPNEKILHASVSPTQIIISTGGGKLHYLEIENQKIKKIKDMTLEYEVASLDIHPLGNDTKSSLCVAGLWTDFSLRLISLPNLEQVQQYKLPVEVLPRSVIFATFEGIHYLLCGLGDGHLFSFHLNPTNGKLTESKKISLGTKPIRLTLFTSKDNIKHVFAASDRPTVIYSNNQKLLYSNVNLKDVNYMCPFNSEFFQDCLAIAREDSLMIGSIDEIQKLHIRTVQLGEQALRICYHESSQTLIVSATRFTEDAKSGIERQTHLLLLIDAQTFEKLNEFVLDKEEMALSLASTRFADDDKEYLVAGTGYVVPEESQPRKGRVLVFDIRQDEDTKQFNLVAERDTKGSVNTLAPFNKGKLLAGVNGSIALYKWGEGDDGHKELTVEYQARNRVFTVSLQSVGDFIVSGDVMKSISVFNYKQPEGRIEEIARDNNFYWMSATEIIDQDTFIGAENEYNLFTVRRNDSSEGEGGLGRTLLPVGRYHIGDLVNKFRHGSIVMNLSSKSNEPDTDVEMSDRKRDKMKESDTNTYPSIIDELNKPILYCTVSGAIGIVAKLTKEQYDYFKMVQEAMNQVVKGVGDFKHEDFRAYKSSYAKEPASSFLDGDLIESFLDLKKERQRQVANEMLRISKNEEISTVDEIGRRIEEFAITLH